MNMLWFLVLSALTIVPLFKLLPQYGINPWFALCAVALALLMVTDFAGLYPLVP
jgi:hypothetical protein